MEAHLLPNARVRGVFKGAPVAGVGHLTWGPALGLLCTPARAQVCMSQHCLFHCDCLRGAYFPDPYKIHYWYLPSKLPADLP